MNRLELIDDLNEALLAMTAASRASVWTALPGYIVKYDAAKQTAEVQTTIKAQVTAPDFSTTWVDIPILVDCPVVFPSGGGFTLTFPIAVDDECLVIFASRCIDSWWQSSRSQVPAEFRMHDLSDGFVLVGPRSQPRVLSSVSTTDVVLRSDDGTAHMAIKADKSLDFVSATSVTITAPTITLLGNVVTVGALTNNTKNVGSAHIHSGVMAGSSNTGVPT